MSTATRSDTRNWPELAIGLYDRLTGREAEIIYDFEGFDLYIPSGTGADAEHAKWSVNGTLKIRTQNGAQRPEA